jgi:hypothetical protein
MYGAGVAFFDAGRDADFPAGALPDEVLGAPPVDAVVVAVVGVPLAFDAAALLVEL